MYYLNEEIRFVEDAAIITVDDECAVDLLNFDEIEDFGCDIKLGRISQSQKVKLAKLLNDRFDLDIKIVGQPKDKANRSLIDAMFSLHTRLQDDAIENGEIDVDDDDDKSEAIKKAWEQKVIEAWEDMNIEEQLEHIHFCKNDAEVLLIAEHVGCKQKFDENKVYPITREQLSEFVEKQWADEYGEETSVEQVTINDEIIEVTTDSKYEIRRVNNGKWIDFIDYQGNKLETVRIGEANKYVKIPSKKMLRAEFIAKNQPKPEKAKVVIPTADQFIHNQRGYIPPQVFGLMGDKIVYNWLGEILAIDKDGNTIKLMDYSDFAAVLVQEKCKKAFNMAKFLGIKSSSATKTSCTQRVAANNGPRSGYPTADKPSSQRFLDLALSATRNNGHFTLESDVMPQTGWAYSNARNYLSYVQSWGGYQLEKLGNRKYRLTQS